MANFYPIYVVIKGGKPIDVSPYLFRICMKDMGTVMMLMTIGFFDVASIAVATDVSSFIYY